MQRSIQSLIFSTPSTSGRIQRLPPGWTALKARPLQQHKTHCRARSSLQIVCAASQRSSLTLKQRWLSAKNDVENKAVELRTWFMALPPVAAILNLLHMIQQFLFPYLHRLDEVRETVAAWMAVRNERYREFIADETKRSWQWQRRNEAELHFWTGVVNGIFGILATIMWETLTPATFAIAVLPPLWIGWALHDNLLKSPIFYALLLMMPLKFPIGYPIRWI